MRSITQPLTHAAKTRRAPVRHSSIESCLPREFSVSSFMSRLPRRKRVVSGSKTVDSMSVQGRLRDALGSVLCRFGGGFFTRRKLRLERKHRPHHHLNSPRAISANPNTVFARRWAPKINRKTPPPSLRPRACRAFPETGLFKSKPFRWMRGGGGAESGLSFVVFCGVAV